jgi:hypothetical protein
MNSGTPVLGAGVGTIIGSGNYNSYAPTLTGGGASGNWGINVTGTAGTLSSGQGSWSGTGVINNVVGLLAWKNYGNSHVIFDASNSTTPSGTSCSNANPQNNWTGTYPTLMGWNGANTYGVRVDSARISDSVTNGVYTTGDQTIGGAKTFSTQLSISTGTSTGLQILSPAGNQGLWIRTGWTADGTATPVSAPTNVQFQSSGNSGGTFSFTVGNSNIITIDGNGLSSAGTLVASGEVRGTRFVDTNDGNFFVDPHSRSQLNTLTASGKEHYFGTSTSWDSVGFGAQTNVHFQGHPQFWIGAGNAYWYRGGISTEHDLLLTTMTGYNTRAYYRGITFAADSAGTGNSGYRLGRWVTYDTDWRTSRLHVDGSLAVGYGARGTRQSDVSDWPRDFGLWSRGRDEPGYGNDRQREFLFSPTSNGGGPWGTFSSLEVSSVNDGNADIPALFRIHQWGSGAAEFWKPLGTVLFLRETPIDGSITHGNWFTRFHVQREIYSSGDIVAYASDKRLKENYEQLTDAVVRVQKLTGMTFDWKEGLEELGFSPSCKHEVGVLAQDVQLVLPEAVKLAPFDDNGKGESISGENYLTVKYEKIVPLLIEAIKEQQTQIENQQSQIEELKQLVKQLTEK